MRGDDTALGVEHGGRAGLERGIDGKETHGFNLPRHARPWAGHPRLFSMLKTWMAGTSPAMTQKSDFACCLLHRPHFDHVGYEMLEQVLDAVLERGGRGRAARAGALHIEIDDAFLVAAKGDVAAVAGYRRAHAGLDQILDGGNRIGVLGVEE